MVITIISLRLFNLPFPVTEQLLALHVFHLTCSMFQSNIFAVFALSVGWQRTEKEKQPAVTCLSSYIGNIAEECY